MNSQSKCSGHDDHKPERPECPTIIKCSCPNGTTIPSTAVSGNAFTVSSFNLNTSRLDDPCTKLEFASNLIPTAFTGILNFQVLKRCTNQVSSLPIGPAWNYTATAAVNSHTFSFFVCDCDCCTNNDCCNYSVVATIASATVTGTLAINNATLGAIVTCSKNNCC